MRRDALEKLIDFAGGKTHLAKMLGVSTPSVNSWASRGLISERGAELVGNHPTLKTFKKSYLRPDIYDETNKNK